jgi:acyl carrier protein
LNIIQYLVIENQNQHSAFPLDRLVHQLELAGFRVTPAMRLRLLKTLGGPGKRFLNDTKKLKYILCPVVAQSAAEQQRFYELFDRFHKDVLAKEVDIPEEPKVSFWDRFPSWTKWVLISLSILALVGYGIYKVMTIVPPPDRGILPETSHAPIGDTISFTNMALPEVSFSHKMYWSLSDNESGKVHLHDTTFHWQFEVPEPGENYNKTVQLIYYNKETANRDTFTTPLVIECKNGVPDINVTTDLPSTNQWNSEKKKEIKFTIGLEWEDNSVSCIWDFGDGSDPAKGLEVKHTYEKDGNYAIEVRVTKESVSGYCEVSNSFPISIGQEKAFLALKTLKKDKMEPMASFSWATWIFMSLLALAIVYYWVRWFARKAPEEEKKEKGKGETPEHFKSSDRAPYLIPYRSQNAFIQVDPELFKFADTMRSRQEGLRRSMDIPSSVKATIEGGGFPRLLEKRDTQPTEYLFLVDEQSLHSHQAKLFKYLIDFLKGKDILLETFYYNSDFNRFWNKYHPKGIDDVMLPRLYQHHRLVVMGNGHGLLDPFGQGNQQLRQSAQNWLKVWKERLLITPLPPESWTWKEGALHKLFPVFPADIMGLGQAMNYIESGQAEDEHQPDFETWKTSLLSDRTEEDVNRRRWHRLKAYKDFLKGHPDVYKWMCALAVCPQPNWETTIAIGKALKPKGVEVTFDKLLLLARIPFLQSGILPGRLRIEMLHEIDEETERLAREVIKEELEAIKAKIKGGHANFELQSQLAIQRFALQPDGEDSKSDIRFLLDRGLLGKRQVAELEKAVQQHTLSMPDQGLKEKSMFTKAAPLVPSLDEFLEEAPPPPPKRPFVTPDLVKALTATIVFIMLFLTIWNFDGTDRLYQLAFGEEKTLKTVGEDNQLQNLYHFVQEVLPIDSTKILNNSSVSIYENLLKREIQKEINGDTSFLSGILPTIDRGFDRALQYTPDYELAKTNLGKLWYNVGAELYNGHLANNQLTESKGNQLQGYFQEAIPYDSILLDALHGKGLLHYYANKTDSAFQHYGQILRESDSLYFDTLSLFPHLEYLLNKGSLENNQDLPQIADKTGNSQRFLWCLDNAHGELTPGKKSPVHEDGRQLFEYKFTRDIVKRVMTVLDRKGIAYYNVVPEVEVDNFLQQRVERVNNKASYIPKLLISVHCNAGPAASDDWINNNIHGIETYYFPNSIQGEKLGVIVQKHLTAKMNWADRGLRSNSSFSLLQNANVPTVQSEIGFYNNKQQFEELMTNEKRQQIADALVEAILEIERYGLEGAPPGNNVSYVTPQRLRWINPDLVAPENNLTQIVAPEDTNYSKISKIIENILAVEKSEVTLQTKLVYDLGADDVDINEVRLAIEKEFKIRFTEDDFIVNKNAITVQWLCDLTKLRLNKKRTADTDKDGVPDDKDDCPNTAPEEPVDANGCSNGDYFRAEEKNRKTVQNLPPFKEPEMILVKGGTFQMGCKEEKGKQGDCPVDARPVHEVRLDDFLIGKHEVTQAEWETIMENNPSNFSDCPDCPVESITWEMTQEYITKLNTKTGDNYRLPTEAEWEYASRGGTTRALNTYYSGSDDLNSVAWYLKNSASKTHPAGTKNANALGLFDMSGNVQEWCSDLYSDNYYEKSRNINPKGPNSGSYHVARGGSFADDQKYCTSFYRLNWNPKTKAGNIGLRLARSL